MINPFIIKKYAALIISGIATTILFFIGTLYYSLWGGIGFFLVGLILAVIVGSLLLKNPFTIMLEGKGLLAINIDSTGILRPFIVGLQSPYIVGKLGKKRVKDVFDRNTVLSIAMPIKNSKKAILKEEGGIRIDLDEKDYNKGRFGLFHYPVLIYNEQIQSIITKDFLSKKERDTFAEHGVLYLNRKMEELSSNIRDFGRYVVDSLKPGQSFLKSKWAIVVIIIVLAILGFMFAPSIIKAFQGVSANVGGVLDTGGATIVPR